MIKSLCKIVPQGQIYEGVWGAKYYVQYLGRLIFLDFGSFLVINSWVPPLIPQYTKLSLKGHKRSLTAHRACVGIKKWC